MIPSDAAEIIEDLDDNEELTEGESPPDPSKTWSLDLKNNRIWSVCDGRKSLEDWIYCALSTSRLTYEIFSSDYGAELGELMGMPRDWCITEFKRLVQEALLIDDRIKSVGPFEFSGQGNILAATFTVTSIGFDLTIQKEVDTSV